MGPWYRKVNETIRRAYQCETVGELVELLGKPDRVDGIEQVITPSKFFEQIGSQFRFGEQNSEYVLTFVDPYRPRRRYKFALTGEKVESSWKEMVDESNKHWV